MKNRKLLCAAFLFAISAVTAGCNEKTPKPKEDDVPETVDSFGDYAEDDYDDTAFVELADEDFRTININLNVTENEAPVNVRKIDLSDIDVGQKVPVCYRAENVEKSISEHNVYYIYDENGHIIGSSYGVNDCGGTPLYDWHDYIDKPVDGLISNCYVRGKDCFLYVEYDDMMGVSGYNDAVLRYDAESGDTEEIYSWSAEDINEYSCGRCVFSGDSVFLEYYRKTSDTASAYTIKRLDLDTNEVTTVFEDNANISSIPFMTDNVGNLYFDLQYYEDDDSVITKTYQYNEESDKFEVIIENEPADEIKSRLISNGKCYSLVKAEGKMKLFMVCDNYKVGTCMTNGAIVYADEKCFVLSTDEKLDVYNIPKKEHYVFSANGFGSQVVMNDGKLFIGNSSGDFEMPVYCVIPDLGLTYPIVEKGNYDNITSINGEVCFTGKRTEIIQDKSPDGLSVMTHQVDIVESVYVVSDK